jgi:hypothetical protein
MKKLLPFAFLLAISSAYAQQPANPPLVTAPWSNKNPDIVAIISKDPSAGAAFVTFGPGAPADGHWAITVSSPATGSVELDVLDTYDNIQAAKAFCDLIDASNVLRVGNISCQDTSPVLGVSNWMNNLVTVVPRTGFITGSAGTPSRDAGPTFALERLPEDGAGMPPGSNIGQIIFASHTTANGGHGVAQYATLSGTVLNPDIGNVQGMFQFYTAITQAGPFANLSLRMNLWRGIVMCDTDGSCPTDVGMGTINVPRSKSDGSGGGFFIGAQKICVDPKTNLLYLAPGSACPPGG